MSEGVRSARAGQKWEKELMGNRSSEFLEWERGDSLDEGDGLGMGEEWWDR